MFVLFCTLFYYLLDVRLRVSCTILVHFDIRYRICMVFSITLTDFKINKTKSLPTSRAYRNKPMVPANISDH